MKSEVGFGFSHPFFVFEEKQSLSGFLSRSVAFGCQKSGRMASDFSHP